MDIEKLYQRVWEHVFAESWMRYDLGRAVSLADTAAREAVETWDPAKAHAVISAKAKES